jgi:hypothetical protein
MPPTLALEIILNIPPLEIKAQQFAINSWYRLIRTGITPQPNLGHHKTMESTSTSTHPFDFTSKQLIFPSDKVSFLYPAKEQWLEEKVDTK